MLHELLEHSFVVLNTWTFNFSNESNKGYFYFFITLKNRHFAPVLGQDDFGLGQGYKTEKGWT